MFLLTISVGRFWSVHSVLEFNAIKKNLRIMSDIERVFWTVLLRMASCVFLFLTLSDSSLVRNWFVCKEPRYPSYSVYMLCLRCKNLMMMCQRFPPIQYMRPCGLGLYPFIELVCDLLPRRLFHSSPKVHCQRIS